MLSVFVRPPRGRDWEDEPESSPRVRLPDFPFTTAGVIIAIVLLIVITVYAAWPHLD